MPTGSKPGERPGGRKKGTPLVTSPVSLLLTARGIRSFGDGLISLVLPVYLLELGYGAVATGLIATATLLGSALLTLLVGLSAGRAPGRTFLIGAALLMASTGVAFAVVSDFWPLVVIAFVGTLNPSSGDVSVFLPLEQAELASAIPNRDRTRLFARYGFTGSVMAAVGALAAGLPEGAAKFFGTDTKLALQGAFLAYAGLGAVVLAIYRRLPGVPERQARAPQASRAGLSESAQEFTVRRCAEARATSADPWGT
jgi:MFS family permease